MKRILHHLFLLILIGTLCNCTKDANEISNEQPELLSDIELLKQLGYDLTGMIEREEYYMIQPDIIVSKSRLQQIREEPQTRMQYHRGNGILSEQYQTIYIKSTSNIYETYRSAYEAAIEEWNNLPDCNIKFVISSSYPYAVDIGMWYNGVGDPNFIYVERPSYGLYGKHITINLSSYPTTFVTTPAYSQIKNLIMHALGHLVGLEHVYASGTPPLNLYPNTVRDDPFSIMRTENDLKKEYEIWNGFSELDKKALKIIYPKIIYPDPKLTLTCKTYEGQIVDKNELQIGDIYFFKPILENYNNSHSETLTVEELNGNGDFEKSQMDAGEIRLRFFKPGIYKVTATSNTATMQIKTSKTYNVYAQEPWIEGPKKVELGGTYNFTISCWNPKYSRATFDVEIHETLFNDPQYTIINQTENTLSIRFNGPGEYKIYATMRKDTTNVKSCFNANIYYRPDFKHIEAENRVYFYTDATFSNFLSLPYPVCIEHNYDIKIASKVAIPKNKILIPKGNTSVDVAENAIYIHIPENSSSFVKPYFTPNHKPQ